MEAVVVAKVGQVLPVAGPWQWECPLRLECLVWGPGVLGGFVGLVVDVMVSGGGGHVLVV